MCDLGGHTPHSSSVEKNIRRPRPHQLEALRNWQKQGRRGILAHATGSGKTHTALLALREHLTTGGVGLILVPSRLLLKQWRSEIVTELPETPVLMVGDRHRAWRRPGRLESFSAEDDALHGRIILATMQTASGDEFARRIYGGMHLFVVADEVHQSGSAKHQRLFAILSGPRLGLSATPVRYGDPDGTERILEYFGPIVEPHFTIVEAPERSKLWLWLSSTH